MKHSFAKIIRPLTSIACIQLAIAETKDAASDFIALEPEGVRNLGIQYALVEPRDFETTIFAIGHIREIPRNHSVLSSRIAGRIVEVNVFEGDMVKKGDVLVRVESRQPGSPPPVIELKAPRDGLVASSHIRLGEPVEPNKELLDIMDLHEVWAIAQIPEDRSQQTQTRHQGTHPHPCPRW